MKNKTKWLLIIIAILILAGGLIVAFRRIDAQETKTTISPAIYRSGALSTNAGTMIEDNTAIYTPNFYDVKGLECELKDKADISYRVFYYTDNQDFISCTEALTGNDIGSVPSNAKYFKICIYTVDDVEINVLQIIGYASELTVKIDK